MKLISIAAASILMFHSNPAPATRASPAEMAIARLLIAEADKQAILLKDNLADISGSWFEAHILADDWPAAAAIIQATSPQSRDRLYKSACSAAADLGNVKLARQILDDHLQNDTDRDNCFGRIAIAEAQKGDLQIAIAQMKAISQAKDRFFPLADLAIAQAKAGDRAGAKTSCEEMVKIIHDMKPPLPNYQLEKAEGTLAQTGQMTEAWHLAEGLNDRKKQNYATIGIAEGQACAGDIDGFAATRSALPENEQAFACVNPGIYLANHGDIHGAQRLVGLCDDPGLADVIRTMIGRSQARSGDIPGALATAAQIKKQMSGKLFIYYGVVKAQSLAGDATGATDTLAVAQKIAYETSRAARPDDDLMLADMEAAMGHTQAAITTIAKSSNDPAKLLHDYSFPAMLELEKP